MTTNVCRQCSADTHLKQIEHVEGTDSGIKVKLDGVPTVECTNGHVRFPTTDYPLEMIQALLKVDDIVTARAAVQKGLFRKHNHCPDCGKQLPDEAASSSNGNANVGVREFDPVAVQVAVPLYRCPGCGKEATLPEQTVARGIMQAIANAFKSANITPG